MIKVRFVLLASLAGCVVLTAGCKSLAGAACMKAPTEADVGDRPLLRMPVGLDAVDTSSALKVPPLDETKVVPAVVTHCLEDPPLIQPLPDPVKTEKERKKEAKKAARKASAAAEKKEP